MKAVVSLRSRRYLASVLLALLVSSFAIAQTATQMPPIQPRITAPIDPVYRQVLSHTVHPLLKSAADLGAADSSLAMKDMLLMLQPSASQAAIAQYIDGLHNPQSVDFHKWLTPEQYAAKFGIADADVQTVTTWLAANGFTVEQVARGKRWIRFSGTASQVESTFRTAIHGYSLNGATNYANATDLSIPVALSPVVAGVVSMSNFQSLPLHTPPQKMVRGSNGKMTLVSGAPSPSPQGVKPDFTGNSGGQVVTYLAPADFSTIYGANAVLSSGINGAGVSIAVVGRSDIAISDVEAFRTIAGLPLNDPTVTYANSDPGVVSGDDIEASLDVEWAGAIAPQDSIDYVIGATTNAADGADIASSYIVDNVTAPIMTYSFASCEQLEPDSEVAFYQNLWQQAAAEGITVLVAAGDAGSSACSNVNATANDGATAGETTYGFGVSAQASTPYDVAVGGTELNDLSNPNTYWNTVNGPNLGSAFGYIPEAAWNESCTQNIPPSLTNCFLPSAGVLFAGGGGASSCISRTVSGSTEICAGGYPKPTWQTGTGVPQDGVRDLPDVSLSASTLHDSYLFCYEGDCQWKTSSDGSITLEVADLAGGTAAAASSMAGAMALVEQKAGAFQGVANYELYSLAAAQTSGSCNSSSRTDPTQPSTCVFNDITAGSNAVPCNNHSQDCGGTDYPVVVGAPPNADLGDAPGDADMNGYRATAGYDLASGLGSVNISNLVNNWSKQKLTASSITLTLSQTSFQHGTAITLSGAVTPMSGTGTPTGSVNIQASSTSGEVVGFSLAAGAFSGSTINLPGGSYTVTAVYSGDGMYAASTSAPVSVTVTPENSTVTGSSFVFSPNRMTNGIETLNPGTSVVLGFGWFLQFNVAGVSGSTRATGTITLSVGSTVVGTYPLSPTGEIYVSCGQGGSCDFPVGTLNFTAKYSGDSSFNPSTTTYQFLVVQGEPLIAVTVNNQTPLANSKIVAVISIYPTDPITQPTGTVTLTRTDTGAVLGSAVIQAGVATIPFNAGSGLYEVIPIWPGDANYASPAHIDGQFIQPVNSPGTLPVTVALSLGGSSFALGQQTQYTVTVASTQKSTSTPSGNIVLYNGFNQIAAQIPVTGGKATGTIQWTSAGPQSVYAAYSGDNHFAGANSAFMPVTVTQATPTLAVTPIAAYAAVGSTTSVRAILGSASPSTNVPAPTGSIQFYNSLNGAAATALGTAQGITTYNGTTLLATLAPTLPQGSNVVTAVYSGDANWKSVSSAPSAPIVVGAADFVVTATPNPLTVVAGQSAALSVATQSFLGYSTAITLSCGGTLPAGMSCNSATVSPGSAGSITLTTIAPGTGSATASTKPGSRLGKIAGTAAFAAIFFLCIPNRRRFAPLSVLLAAVAVAFGVSGCGGSAGKASQPSSISLTSSSTKVASGTGVTFQASVTPASSNAGVTFYDGTTALGSAVTPVNGVATYTTTSLGVGTHAITAQSSSINGSQAASSGVVEQAITGSFTLAVTGNSGGVTQSVNVPATLQ